MSSRCQTIRRCAFPRQNSACIVLHTSSSIRTITVGPGVAPSQRTQTRPVADYTASGEFHPALKTVRFSCPRGIVAQAAENCKGEFFWGSPSSGTAAGGAGRGGEGLLRANHRPTAVPCPWRHSSSSSSACSSRAGSSAHSSAPASSASRQMRRFFCVTSSSKPLSRTSWARRASI